MAMNVKISVYRGTLSSLSTLASTGQAGVLAWTNDSNELYVDSGSGVGIGVGNAWLRTVADNKLFTAASSGAMVALAAGIGDFCNRTDLNQIFLLTAYPATTAGNWIALSPNSSITGIVGLSGPTASEWVSYVDASGVQHLSQPAFTDISGTLAQTQLPATIGAGSNLTLIDCGTF